MRVLMLLLLVLACLLGGAWLGGESWLAGRATALVDQRDDLAAARIAPLRDMRRAGILAEQVQIDGQAAGQGASLMLPRLDLWVPPTAPNDVQASLPDTAQLVLRGATHDLAMQDAGASLRFSPVNGMSVSRAIVRADQFSLDGAPAIAGLHLQADLARMGNDAPRDAGAAYDLTLAVDGFDPLALSTLGLPPPALPGQVGLDGTARLWLTSAPGRGMMRGQGAQPQPVGFRTDGLVLRIGELEARLVGQVVADDQGRASGRLALYSADSRGWLTALSDAGLIPASGVMLGGALLKTLSATPMEPAADPQADKKVNPALARFKQPAMTFPEPAEGEVRLPIFLRDGKVFLGTIPIGSAPMIRPR